MTKRFFTLLFAFAAMVTMANAQNTINGHEYVDLGLTSGTLWATCNVGATKPEEYGDYFAWGETKPKSDYSWNTYKWCDGSKETLTKYNDSSYYGKVDNKSELDLEDDAAHANWGNQWRMPNKVQIEELAYKCHWRKESLNGVEGFRVVGPNENSIFLPATGHYNESEKLYETKQAYYWSRFNGREVSYYPVLGVVLHSYSGDPEDSDWDIFNRSLGITVRAIVDKNAVSDGIDAIKDEMIINNHYYSVDGKKLSGEPTKPGLYIHNGKKVVK